jgi:SSS family solute:Na+ symporter
LISGITFGKDIVSRIKNISDETAITRWTRIGILIAAVISISLAVTLPSVVRIWYTIGTAISPGLIIPVVAGYYPRLKISACMTFTIMLSGWLVSTGWLVYGNIIGEYPLGVEPMYPGLLVGIILWVIGKVSE